MARHRCFALVTYIYYNNKVTEFLAGTVIFSLFPMFVEPQSENYAGSHLKNDSCEQGLKNG